MIWSDDISDSVEGFIQILDDLVSSHHDNRKRVSPKHPGYPISCAIDIDDSAILGNGIRSCKKDVAGRGFLDHPSTFSLGLFGIDPGPPCLEGIQDL